MTYCTEKLSGVNAQLEAPHDATIQPRDYKKTEIDADVAGYFAANPSTSTVVVKDVNGVSIGSVPRTRPA